MEPRAEYDRRLAARRAEAERLERRDRLLGNARALVFFGGVGIAIWRFGWWLAPIFLLFVILVIVHDRAVNRRKRAERAAAHYRRGLDRLDGKWQGPSGARFANPHHPYSADLDLFGAGSLFERLCTARTRAGEDALARFLVSAAPPEVVRARQAAVDELRERLDLRESLDLVGEEARAEVEAPDELAVWGERPQILDPGNWVARAGAFVVGAAGLAAFVWWAIGGPVWPLAAAILVEMLLYRALRPLLEGATSAIFRAQRELSVLGRVLAILEKEPLAAPRLAELQKTLRGSASDAILRLSRLADLVVAQKNQFFAPLAYLILWPVHAAFAVESWRKKHGAAIARWLGAAGELEALAALGGYAFESPSHPFPEIVDELRLEAEGLAHPLLKDAVANDLSLGETRLLLVSGSNMSGKSTLLRTVGVNVVLALAGAPVRARRLCTCPLSVGATLRVQDSLQEGASRFYAEITRLRQILEAARGELPVLFLLDEILGGTNSHDRRIGAEGVVRGLVERGAIGLVTTHDLALAKMEIPGAINVHFEDHLEDGKLRFDYRMRPGVVEKSNALELMRSIGLEV